MSSVKLYVGAVEYVMLARKTEIPGRLRVGILDGINCLDGCEIGDVGLKRTGAYNGSVAVV